MRCVDRTYNFLILNLVVRRVKTKIEKIKHDRHTVGGRVV